MSRPTPNPKQNFIQTALIMVMVYLGVQLFFHQNQAQNNNPGGPKLVTRADYLKQVETNDRLGLEATNQKLLGDYNQAIDQDVKSKVLTPAQGESEKIQANTIVANDFLKGGLIINDSNKIRAAYQILQPFFRKDQDNPGWNAQLTVYKSPKETMKTSPNALRQSIIDTLSKRNKTDLVWGMIPGGYQLIDFLVNLTGAQPYFSYAFAAFLLAFAVRGAVFPLAQKQLMFSRQMSQLTPRIAEIKKQYQNDTTEVSRRTMELYKEYGINPAAGCLPAFVQMPLFLTVYQCMLHYQFQFSHGYFLWINPATSALTHGFVAHDLGQQDYILIVIYGITMTISTLLTPVTDPTQYKQQRMMGVGMSIMITVFMFIGVVPVVSGFVLYWTFTNLLATAQSFRAYRMPLPPLVKVNAPNGGVYPSKGIQGKWMKMLEDAQKVAEEKNRADGPNIINPPSNGKAGKNGEGDVPLNGNSNGKAPKNTEKSDSDSKSSGKEPKYKPKKRK